MLLLVAAAFANGQTSHQWITLQAIGLVPRGELADFLARDDVRAALLNGTMFPDGGYAVDDDYGEMAHWEPTQDAYLDWIVDTWDDPVSDPEGAQHVAFLLGMRSHGLADQVYDSTFMERSRAWDPAESWACCSMDEATDVAMAAETGPGTVPEKWWPEELLTIFSDRGHAVDFATVDQGQDLLALAIAYVGASSEYDETVAEYTAEFPWACTHQVDPDVIGNPPDEARFVAAYWQVTWDRLHGASGWDAPLLATVPADGYQVVRDATSPDARLALVLARGLDTASAEAAVSVATADGTPVPVTVDLFYGTSSHVLNVAPVEDWAADTDFVVTIAAGVTTWDGAYTLESPITTTFTTRAPVEDVPDPDPAPCGCGNGSAALLLLALGVRRR